MVILNSVQVSVSSVGVADPGQCRTKLRKSAFLILSLHSERNWLSILFGYSKII